MQLLLTDVFRTPEVWAALGLSMPEDGDVAGSTTLRLRRCATRWRHSAGARKMSP
ncbi:MAG: hypothetical protein AAGP08_13030 [Pseudomonadota bacterium]